MVKFYCDRCGQQTHENREQLTVEAAWIDARGENRGSIAGKPGQIRREFCQACSDTVFQILVGVLCEQVSKPGG